MTSNGKQYNGTGGSPINITYPRASRQTEEQVKTRGYRQRESPRIADDEMLDDGWTVEKPHTSAVRYDRSAVPPRRSATRDDANPKKTRLIKERRPLLARVLIVTGFGLLALALGIMALSALGSWWQVHTDDVTYGRPRTFQTDQFVGHGDSPAHPNHFIALNLGGIVEVVEIDTRNVRLDHAYYITTTNPLNPVTLTFPTIDGKQYMYISIGDSSNAYTVAMVNDGQEFTGAQH
jgi:hypothetical protein